MELDQLFLGITPEALDTVYINLAIGKGLSMIDIDMTITTKHKRVPEIFRLWDCIVFV